MKVTFFTDLHHGDREHLDFNCKRALPKLKALLADTEDSDCYVSLGDLVDFLHEDSTDLYDQALAFLAAQGVCSYGGGDARGREIYHVLGNHESAFLAKERFAACIPHRQGVGSVYAFQRGGVLFAVLDANYDRATQSDDPRVMRSSTSFTFPPAQIQWVRQTVAERGQGIRSILWLCHVACKDIDPAARDAMAEALLSADVPVYIFEGHTHTERFDILSVAGREIPVYTLAPVTFDFTVPPEERAESFFYYTAEFSHGKLLQVQKRRGRQVPADLC